MYELQLDQVSQVYQKYLSDKSIQKPVSVEPVEAEEIDELSSAFDGDELPSEI